MGSRLIALLAFCAAALMGGCAKADEAANIPPATSAAASNDAGGSPGRSAPKEDLQVNPGAGKIAQPGSKAGG